MQILQGQYSGIPFSFFFFFFLNLFFYFIQVACWQFLSYCVPYSRFKKKYRTGTALYRFQIVQIVDFNRELTSETKRLSSVWDMSLIIYGAIPVFTLNISVTNFSHFLWWFVKKLSFASWSVQDVVWSWYIIAKVLSCIFFTWVNRRYQASWGNKRSYRL